MQSNNINTIVEGAMPNTPERLMYASLELQIPENAIILTTDEKDDRFKYLLYAKSADFNKIEIINKPDFSLYDRVKAYDVIRDKFKGGYPLNRLEQNIKWIYDSQRSFTTKDGRIYVHTTYFHPDWRWYLNSSVPTILRECGELFKGKKTENYFYNNPSRAF